MVCMAHRLQCITPHFPKHKFHHIRNTYSAMQSLLLFLFVLFQSEQVIFDAFSSEEFVEKLVAFFSMEEVKGRDRFDIHKYTLFKVQCTKCDRFYALRIVSCAVFI